MRFFCVLMALLVCFPARDSAQAEGVFEWQTATPESQGMSTTRLDALKDDLAKRQTASFVVIRNDAIVYEWYAVGRSAAERHGTASLAKALVGGMSLAVAISDGLISVDDKVSKHVPQWKNDPRKEKITIRHLGSHSSGLDNSRPNEEAQWKDDFWKGLQPPHDPFTISRDLAPVLFEPGEKLHYSNPGIGMLTYAVTAAIRDSPVKDVRTLLRERVMRPIGVADDEWTCGYEKTFVVDGLPLVGSWGGGTFTPRAAARVGRLVLREGDWEGRRLLSEESLRQVTGDAGLPQNAGMGWWTNAGNRFAGLPRDAVWGAGAGHQLLLVVPSLQLVMVRNGAPLQTAAEEIHTPKDQRDQLYDVQVKNLFARVVEAINEAGNPKQEPKASTRVAPYPASRVIAGVEWAPRETIVRQAAGSDNWPLTWADDGELYGAYGDGNGFAPFTDKKLSLGFARISGAAHDFQGINLRSSTLDHMGDDLKGKKASGLLMVDGVLYLLARNAANSQLAWSADHGKTWTWADWRFTTGFGCPTFLNFGPNYSGARDTYVYVYSHDADSAYEASDRMVLARVPKDRIREREAYEYLVELDAEARPQWSNEIGRRCAVFRHTGRCYRTSVSYNAGINRYLWCQIMPESVRREDGHQARLGFGIYDAPEPWGPWTTAYFTNEWDVSPGETCSLPTKWMSQDGRTVHLVFSGDDSFSVRRAWLAVLK
ncbi:MAG: serine hydrolase [Planctomycetaceae bacterium]